MLLAAFADGMSVITENVFENRFMFASELMRMGADIAIEDHHALVRGVDVLQGADVSSTDLRAGAALVLAGIAGRARLACTTSAISIAVTRTTWASCALSAPMSCALKLSKPRPSR